MDDLYTDAAATAPAVEQAPVDIPRYAGVRILDNPFCIDLTYHYYIPPTMTDAVMPGAFVLAPFGRGNACQLALVTEVSDQPEELPPGQILKTLAWVCRDRSFLTNRQLALCFYLTDTTLCTMGEAVRTVIPPAALARPVDHFRATEPDRPPSLSSLNTTEIMLLELLREKGGATEKQLADRFGAQTASLLKRLTRRHLVERVTTAEPPTLPTALYYSLARPAEEIRRIVSGEDPALRLRAPKQTAVLRALLEAGCRLEDIALRQLTEAGPAQFRPLMERGLLMREELDPYASAAAERVGETALPNPPPAPHQLSEEQAAAIATLEALVATGKPAAALLHGVTGSGKTCVMLEMIDRMLAAERGCIILLPEIGLTPQMLRIFRGRYGELVSVVHSGLSPGERLAAYRRIEAGLSRVVVGTRSAVFAPVRNLGLIVMDEEQEHTYKSDMDPKYHARDIARFRCAGEGALLLLASATPSLESYQKAMEGKYTLITMKHRYGEASLPAVYITDMRGELAVGNTSPLSRPLVEELRRVREAGEQSILFLNRRGYNQQVVCMGCGKAITCSRCSVALHVHADKNGQSPRLRCHWCGAGQALPATCPDCGSSHLSRIGYGTQRLEAELETHLPGVRVLRMDADTTGAKEAYSDLLGRFRAKEADILLGTQMVTKGHDFPDVTLVGVLMADMSLYLDDYRAAERTFSLITQVIGRAGRKDKPGLAVIQTMNPQHDVLRRACAQDYETFFAGEIKLRRLLQFPPFCDIVLCSLTSPDEQELHAAGHALAERIKLYCINEYRDVPLLLYGPFEAPVYRVDNVYRTRMMIKCRLNRRSRALFAEVLRTFSGKTHGRQKCTLSIDLNPSHL